MYNSNMGINTDRNQGSTHADFTPMEQGFVNVSFAGSLFTIRYREFADERS